MKESIIWLLFISLWNQRNDSPSGGKCRYSPLLNAASRTTMVGRTKKTYTAPTTTDRRRSAQVFRWFISTPAWRWS